MVEQLTVNQLVAGSNPVSGAIEKAWAFVWAFSIMFEAGSNQAFL